MANHGHLRMRERTLLKVTAVCKVMVAERVSEKARKMFKRVVTIPVNAVHAFLKGIIVKDYGIASA